MAAAVAIRDRRPEDLAALATVLAVVHGQDGYPVEGVTPGWLESSLMLGAWVAVVGSQLAGHVMLSEAGDGDEAAALWEARHHRPLSEIAVVGRLFVGPGFRGSGAGAGLMTAAATRAVSLGRGAVLDVMDKDRTAIALYERLGWQRLGSFLHRYDGGTEAATGFELPVSVAGADPGRTALGGQE